MKTYQIVNGTSYDSKTDSKIVNILESARLNKTRLILDFGDVETGKSWNETFDTRGTIGRSTGNNKIPLLIKQKNSTGGGAILDRCIVKIMDSKTKRTLYIHPNYTNNVQ